MGAVPIKKGYFGGRRESDCASLAPLTSLMVTRGLTVRAHIPGWPSRTTRATHASRPWRLLEKLSALLASRPRRKTRVFPSRVKPVGAARRPLFFKAPELPLFARARALHRSTTVD